MIDEREHTDNIHHHLHNHDGILSHISRSMTYLKCIASTYIQRIKEGGSLGLVEFIYYKAQSTDMALAMASICNAVAVELYHHKTRISFYAGYVF